MLSEYPNLSKLALIVLILPYSTVSIERTFSVLKQIRGVERNRLCQDSLEACLLAHQALGGSHQFDITDDLFDQYSKMRTQDEKSSSDESIPDLRESLIIEKEAEYSRDKVFDKVNFNDIDESNYIIQSDSRKRLASNPLNLQDFTNTIMKAKPNQDYSTYSYISPKISIDLSQSRSQEIAQFFVKDISLPNSQ